MNTGIFLRCPVSVAERIRAVIRQENTERAAAKLDPFALYKGEPCLPPYFARAGERLIDRVERFGAPRLRPINGVVRREATLNVNFDVSAELAARAAIAIIAINTINDGRAGALFLRSGQPSMPAFFLRAGLLELARDEMRKDVSAPFAIAQTTAGKTVGFSHADKAGKTRSEAVRGLLRRAPATMDDLVAAGFSRYEARNTISSLVTKGDVVRQGKALYALTASGRAKAAQHEGT